MIKIGTSGYSFKDWKGTVYPEKIKDKDMLDYYHQQLGFDLVEINMSYYRIPSQKAVESWVKRTDDNFKFTIKLHKDITLNDSREVNWRQVDNKQIIEAFQYSFEPMIRSGKSLSFLAQFGPVFCRNRNNLDYLKKLRDEFKDLPITVEFRHNSWLAKESRDDTFKFLRDNNLGYAAVDEPSLRNLAPLIAGATSDIGYIRLHGRNKSWFDPAGGDRYNYFYNDNELIDFILIIRVIEQHTIVTVVLFNNCHAGSALKNAIRLRQLMGIVNSSLVGTQKKIHNYLCRLSSRQQIYLAREVSDIICFDSTVLTIT